MESSISSYTDKFFLGIVVLIIILIIGKLLFMLNTVLFKHFSKKNLQEKEFIITFASEKERDAVLALIEKDKKETEELEKQAKDFGLK